MHPHAEPSITQLSDFQNWLSAAKDEESSRNQDYAGRSDSDHTLLSHLHSLLSSGEGQVHEFLECRVYAVLLDLERVTICVLQALASMKTELLRGDKVVANGGDFVGLTGTVAQVIGDEIKVSLDDHLRTEGIPDELLFNIRDLVKRYDIGDAVAVTRGKETGATGIVVAIGNSALAPRMQPNVY
jgi:hypothetical protein